MNGKKSLTRTKSKVRIHSKQKAKNKMATNESQKDVFSVYARSFDKVKGTFEKTATQSLQSYTNLSQEVFTAWSNFVHTATSISQSYANKIGVNAAIPETSVAVISETTDAFVKAIETNNKVVQTAFDATVQNIKTINQNASAFAELNQNIINSWMSNWKPRI
ncbi:MAG: hypothetical protein LV468_01655 [Candidatus Nitrosotenuis sp.]|uniref:hypothetical protein n=1 Tax=Candidatus Nitrosotenuis cloacae TaxID=1603555 RepID=UPI0022826A56|nr:hypothetical protein [Candidatus Nitrosotenuis cloacae]MDC8437688.1 hypothetical protein [Candidatus Nitrosotenuis sp.]